MTVDDFEAEVHDAASRFAFIQAASTIDKTTNTVKLRLHITADCSVQVYANVQKGLFSYALVFHRQRIFGRNCEGGAWHRHPRHDPDSHDHGPEGSKAVSPEEFLIEAEQILLDEGVL